MTSFVSLFLSFLISITPSSDFICDKSPLKATIRNNLNGDFSLVNDLEKIDAGSFVVLEWKNLSLMLPISFQSGEITFTDKKWLWSYKNKSKGLITENPRFMEMKPNGKITQHYCNVAKS